MANSCRDHGSRLAVRHEDGPPSRCVCELCRTRSSRLPCPSRRPHANILQQQGRELASIGRASHAGQDGDRFVPVSPLYPTTTTAAPDGQDSARRRRACRFSTAILRQQHQQQQPPPPPLCFPACRPIQQPLVERVCRLRKVENVAERFGKGPRSSPCIPSSREPRWVRRSFRRLSRANRGRTEFRVNYLPQISYGRWVPAREISACEGCVRVDGGVSSQGRWCAARQGLLEFVLVCARSVVGSCCGRGVHGNTIESAAKAWRHDGECVSPANHQEVRYTGYATQYHGC